jgi:regulator of protease activity HflC (stomatin/prohibitin superfamily)
MAIAPATRVARRRAAHAHETRRRAAARTEPRPPWPFNKLSRTAARRAATALLAVMGLLILIGISGVKFARQPLGYVGVVRNGGPLDDRGVRQILLPGSRITYIGLFSQAPHDYPSVRSLRTYTITSDPRRGSRPGVDVASVPTRDGVQLGVEGIVYLRFVGESDPVALKRFDSTVGTRRFPVPSGAELYPWQGADGFSAMLDGVFRPVLDNDLRREVAGFDCAEIVSSCALVRRTDRPTQPAGSALRKIEERIDRTLSTDLLATIGQPYFRELRFRLVRVTLPDQVQKAIDEAQAEYANVSRDKARVQQARYQARRTRMLGRAYRENPSLASIDAIRAAPKGSTVIVNTGGSQSPSIALSGGN